MHFYGCIISKITHKLWNVFFVNLVKIISFRKIAKKALCNGKE